jgi:hypothetical protein
VTSEKKRASCIIVHPIGGFGRFIFDCLLALVE